MTKTFTLLLVCLACTFAKAQTTPSTQPFGKVDIADLELKSCEFEPDANAEILFHKGDVFFDTNYNIIFKRHKRIKIFNENGKDVADVRIEYYSGGRSESLHGLQAQTINLVDGKPVITKVEKTQIFFQKVDEDHTAAVFTFPNVKPGSIIEYKFETTSGSVSNFPDWYFQSSLPTRYSELATKVPDILSYKNLESVHYPYVINKRDGNGNGSTLRALANLPSVPEEPYMPSRQDSYDHILFQLLSINTASIGGRMMQDFSDSWAKVGQDLYDDEDFGPQMGKKLLGEEEIIARAKSMAKEDDRIAYLFNEVKTRLKWNDIYSKFTRDGINKAWEKKVGNSGEINLILCRLLQKSGVKAYPMTAKIKKDGKVNPGYPNSYQFNTTVAYIPVDSARMYVLDASNKYNMYDHIPSSFLNSFALKVGKTKTEHNIVFLQNTNPIRQVVQINGDVLANGKMKGSVDITHFGYQRMFDVEQYKQAGEKKYIDYLINNDNNLKISSIKMEDIDIDSLPLKQKINFDLDLTGSDGNYIYFTPNILTSLKTNPFLSRNRYSDIDFGYINNQFVVGVFNVPQGYKVDGQLKSTTLNMPDNSISFRRVLVEEGSKIMVRYSVAFQKSIFFKENYEEIHDFYKKMYEMLNEPIVLKKS